MPQRWMALLQRHCEVVYVHGLVKIGSLYLGTHNFLVSSDISLRPAINPRI